MIVEIVTSVVVLIGLFFLIKRRFLWKGRNIFKKKYKTSLLSEKEELKLIKKSAKDFPGFEKEKYDAIIIGSGMSGISTAAILAKGYKQKVLVLESHPDVLGGCTHVYEQEGYRFDSGIHYLGNIAHESNGMFQILSDFVTDGECKYDYYQGTFRTVKENMNSEKSFKVHTNLEELKEEFLEKFPKERNGLIKFFNLVEAGGKQFDEYCMIKSLPKIVQKMMKLIGKYGKIEKFINLTVKDVMDDCFEDELVKDLFFNRMLFGMSQNELPFLVFAGVLCKMKIRSYVNGGSTMFARKIIKVITKYGGKCLCNAKVKTILTSKNGKKAIGVKLEDNTKVYADVIVSSIGIKNTYERLVPSKSSKNLQKEFLEFIKNTEPTETLATVNMGFNGKEAVNVELLYQGKSNEKEFAKLKSFNPKKYKNAWSSVMYLSSLENHLRPNKSTVTAFLRVDPKWFNQWKDTKVKNRGNEYLDIKKKMIDYVLDGLFATYPNLKDRLDFVEASTSLTFEHYLGGRGGCIYGAKATKERLSHLNLEVSPISQLFLTGQDCFLFGGIAQWVSAAYTVSKITGNNLLAMIGFVKNPNSIKNRLK